MIPESLLPLRDVTEQVWVVYEIVASAARIARSWVGVSIQVTAVDAGTAPSDDRTANPQLWLRACANNVIVRAFRAAERDGWVTIGRDGYAYPTQKLADAAVRH